MVNKATPNKKSPRASKKRASGSDKRGSGAGAPSAKSSEANGATATTTEAKRETAKSASAKSSEAKRKSGKKGGAKSASAKKGVAKKNASLNGARRQESPKREDSSESRVKAEGSPKRQSSRAISDAKPKGKLTNTKASKSGSKTSGGKTSKLAGDRKKPVVKRRSAEAKALTADDAPAGKAATKSAILSPAGKAAKSDKSKTGKRRRPAARASSIAGAASPEAGKGSDVVALRDRRKQQKQSSAAEDGEASAFVNSPFVDDDLSQQTEPSDVNGSEGARRPTEKKKKRGSKPNGAVPPVSEEELANRRFLKGLLEALLFASDKPLTLRELGRAAKLDKLRTQELLGELLEESKGRGVQIVEVADGFCFRTSPDYGAYVQKMLSLRPVRLSRPQLETLAIVAYRQPVTRPEVDDIRGVDSGQVIKGLLERELVKILGKKDEAGRPMLYGTTPAFLELFNLQSLKELPSLKEFTELSEDSQKTFETEIGESAPQSSEGADQDSETTEVLQGADPGEAVSPVVADGIDAGVGSSQAPVTNQEPVASGVDAEAVEPVAAGTGEEPDQRGAGDTPSEVLPADDGDR